MAIFTPEMLRKTLDAYFAAIAARDPQRIAAIFAEDGEIEDPFGSPIRRGRAEVAAMFAAGVAALATHVQIEVLAALPAATASPHIGPWPRAVVRVARLRLKESTCFGLMRMA